jgi:hypothetical protein
LWRLNNPFARRANSFYGQFSRAGQSTVAIGEPVPAAHRQKVPVRRGKITNKLEKSSRI